MIPISVFLLACAAVYLGVIQAAFSVLMRLSLRLVAERSDRPGALGSYLDDPLLLFIPVRLLLGLVTGTATALLARGIGFDGVHTLPTLLLALAAFVLMFELFVPMMIAGRDPERVLEILLPTFAPVARALSPLTHWIAGIVPVARRSGPPPTPDEAAEEANEAAEREHHRRQRVAGLDADAAREERGRGAGDQPEQQAHRDEQQQRLVEIRAERVRPVRALGDQPQREPHQRAERRLDRAEVDGRARQEKHDQRDHRLVARPLTGSAAAVDFRAPRAAPADWTRSMRPSGRPPLRRSRRSSRRIWPWSRS